MDVLTSSNLKDALRLEEKPKETSEKDWDKIKRTACGVIRPFLTSYDDWDFSEEDIRDLWKQVFDQEHRESLALEEEILSLPIEEKYLDRWTDE